MTVYTVLAPPPATGDVVPDPLSLVFIKEGFCWPALLLPEIWLIARQLWLVLLLDLVAAAVVTVAAAQLGAAALPVAILARLLFALEANGLRRWTYYRHAYSLIGVAEGRRLAEAELRFFIDWAPGVAAIPPPPAAEPEAAGRPSPEAGEVVGLFPVRGVGA
jgi:hypothetical protein